MNKLTKEEKKEIEDIFNISIYSTEYYPHETFSDLFERKLTEWIEQKKKQWQEEAYEKTKTKFFCAIGFLDDKDYQTVYKIIESMGG